MKVSEMTNEELLDLFYRYGYQRGLGFDNSSQDEIQEKAATELRAELLRRLNAGPAEKACSRHESFTEHCLSCIIDRAEQGKSRCREDFLRFFTKWWAGMDLDRLRESMNDPLWANGKHCGDCTKQPMTCNRCALEDIEKQAADFAQFFPAERQDPGPAIGS